MQQASRTFQETVAVIGTAGSSALSSYPARSANISKPPPSQWKREHLLKNYSCKSIQKNVKRCTSIVHHMYSVSKVEMQTQSRKIQTKMTNSKCIRHQKTILSCSALAYGICYFHMNLYTHQSAEILCAL